MPFYINILLELVSFQMHSLHPMYHYIQIHKL